MTRYTRLTDASRTLHTTLAPLSCRTDRVAHVNAERTAGVCRVGTVARLGAGQALIEAWQAVVSDVLPRRRVRDELVSRWLHPGVPVDRCHPNDRDLTGLWIAGKEVRSADCAEGL